MNQHKNGTIMAGAPGSQARIISEVKDELQGIKSNMIDQSQKLLTMNYLEGAFLIDQQIQLMDLLIKSL